MFKGDKCNPFLVLVAIDSVGICMQQFHKDGLVWLLHGVCSMSWMALLRATHVLTQSGVICSPSLHWGTWLGQALWLSIPSSALPFAQPRFLWGRSLTLEGSSPTPAPPWASRQGQSCAPHGQDLGAWLLPACVRRAPSPWLFSAGSCCQPLPGGSVTRDVFVLPLLCAPHKALAVTSFECHRSDIPTIQRSVGCNNSTQWWCLEADFHTTKGLFSWLKISATNKKGGRMSYFISYFQTASALSMLNGEQGQKSPFFLSKHSGVTVYFCTSLLALTASVWFVFFIQLFHGNAQLCVCPNIPVKCSVHWGPYVYMYKWQC